MSRQFLVQVERALDALLDAAMEHNSRQQMLSGGTVAAARLRWMDIQVAPENDSPELVALLYDPIGEALRQSIRTFGQHLFDIYGSTAGMREVAERLLVENAARHVPIIQILDLAWTGIGRESDSWAA